MNAFLKILAGYTLDTYGEKGLQDLCFVFPNLRSGIFFKHYLLEKGKGTFWLPEMYTINEFVSGLSKIEPADSIDISFELYRIYKGMANTPESYDEFYYWGEMLISDFDTLDKYLVPAEKLFKNIADIKEIEQAFGGMEEEQLEVIREFWSHFGKPELSSEKKNFIEMWRMLHPLYISLNEKLRSKGTGYEGMQYREVAEAIDKEGYSGIDSEKVLIAGFNALNSAEKKLFRHLKKSGKGLFFWDYDEEYVNNKVPEAGRFLRKNLEEFPPVDFGENFRHLETKKNIRFFDLPSDILQCKQLGEILKTEISPGIDDFDNTAVILGDETLLEPVVSSLPDTIPHVNITMGYPLIHTPVFSFTSQLLQLQKHLNKQLNQRTGRFYYRDVLDILNHQYLGSLSGPDINSLIGEIKRRNMVYIKPEFLAINSLLKKIFRRIESAVEMPGYLKGILEEILALSTINKEDTHDNYLEKEFTFHIITRLNKLESVFLKDPPDTGIDTFTSLFRKIISNVKIPFQGEPLKGLQIMGILESRLLDFSNIIFLSMNEGVMPRTHSSFSFIPNNLKYAFGMPGREDHDAIYAYYFYRLIQRAENIYILFNSKTDGLRSGERSRYLYQLEYLSNHIPESKTISFSTSGRHDLPVSIRKDTGILNKLKAYTLEGEKAFSPTALNTWIDCRLKFYLSYIAGIREEEEVSEDIDASSLGTLLHETMRIIYSGNKGNIIDEKIINDLRKENHIDRCLKEAFRLTLAPDSNPDTEISPEGRNIIAFEVIKKLSGQILKKDSERLPFTILDLEKKFEYIIHADGRDVRIYGIADRIDLQGGSIYITDYKTGKTEMSYHNLDELFDNSTKNRNRHVLQTFLYSYLYLKNSTSGYAVVPSLYSTRNIFSENFTRNISQILKPRSKPEIINDFRNFEKIFEEKLAILISEIFHPAVPFSQTDDEERCKYCPYKDICHRGKESNNY